jgi:hypothetical protein
MLRRRCIAYVAARVRCPRWFSVGNLVRHACYVNLDNTTNKKAVRNYDNKTDRESWSAKPDARSGIYKSDASTPR